MPDRLSPPTRYEMLLAAERAMARRIASTLDPAQSPELLRRALTDAQDLRADIEDHETQMLGLWRLTRSEGLAAPQREKGAPDAT